INQLPDVIQTIPLIRTFGLLNISNRGTEAVSVTGVDLVAYSKFNKFRESLFRQYQQPVQDGETPPDDASFNLLSGVPYEMLRPGDVKAASRPGMIVGGPIFGIRTGADGKTEVPDNIYNLWCRLEVVPMAGDTISLKDATPAANIYWVVDVSRTKLFQLDDRAVYVPFDVLQKDLRMSEQRFAEEVDGKAVERVRASRCSEIQINLKPGADRMAVLKTINSIVQRISMEVDSATAFLSPVRVEPWEKPQEKFLSAVENEKSLLTFLLGLISLVAIFLIFCILYMIVVEKTRDIGIVKSVGATSQGIAAIFIGYGLAIGVTGGTLGLLAGWGVMTYINEIHTGVAGLIGKPIWDPEVYAFDKIPDTVDPTTAVVVLVVAVLSSVIGAVVPAVRAARLNPVEALRFE
ncbi:MAG TPA: FtsX-like permease family protein, partial [Tepidisphaeraceae bacterium]